MSELIDTIKLIQYHKNQVHNYGAGTPGALGWKEPKGQQTRFEILSQIGNLGGCSVLDVGCGHGDLKTYLDKQYSNIRYAGIDLISDFLDIAIDRHKEEENTVFYLGDYTTSDLPNMDYVLASGALSYRHQDADFIYNMITKLFGCCRMGFGFNLLSGTHFENDFLAGYRVQDITAFCKTLTPDVVLTEGYYDDDYTVYMYPAKN